MAADGAAVADGAAAAASLEEPEPDEVEAAATLRERYLSCWLALTGEQVEVQLFNTPCVRCSRPRLTLSPAPLCC